MTDKLVESFSKSIATKPFKVLSHCDLNIQIYKVEVIRELIFHVLQFEKLECLKMMFYY